MGLKLNTASGSITITAEDGSGNADVTIPRAGIGTVTSLGDLSVTATANELNILDGATVTTTELNYVDGVTSAIQTQLDAKGTVSSLSDLSITATASELNTLDGITATVTELNYVDGVTSSIQTQLDGKLGATAKAADSNLLDGIDSGSFLRSDTSDSMSGTLTVLNTVSVGGNDSGTAGAVNILGGSTGEGGELRIYTSGAEDTTVDNWSIDVSTDDLRIFNSLGDMSAEFIVNGGVKLRYDNSVKFETTTLGADVSGELIADSYNETYAAVTSSSNATTVNCHNGNAFSHTLTQNTTFTFSNPPASGTAFTFSLEIIQDSSASGYTVTWPSSVDWPAATAPTLTATASAKDVFVFYTRDGGTNWYGFTSGQALG